MHTHKKTQLAQPGCMNCPGSCAKLPMYSVNTFNCSPLLFSWPAP